MAKLELNVVFLIFSLFLSCNNHAIKKQSKNDVCYLKLRSSPTQQIEFFKGDSIDYLTLSQDIGFLCFFGKSIQLNNLLVFNVKETIGISSAMKGSLNDNTFSVGYESPFFFTQTPYIDFTMPFRNLIIRADSIDNFWTLKETIDDEEKLLVDFYRYGKLFTSTINIDIKKSMIEVYNLEFKNPLRIKFLSRSAYIYGAFYHFEELNPHEVVMIR